MMLSAWGLFLPFSIGMQHVRPKLVELFRLGKPSTLASQHMLHLSVSGPAWLRLMIRVLLLNPSNSHPGLMS